MSESLRIGLVFSYSLAYCRAILRGIKRFAEIRRDWVFTPVDAGAAGARLLRDLRPAGVVAHVYSPRLADGLAALRRPVVNVCGVLPDLPFPRVGIDDHAVGAAAAAHFLERGFRHFAFVGHTDHAYSTRREAGFAEALASAGHAHARFHEAGAFDPRGRVWALDPRLSRWVRALTKPVGLFACNDVWGVQLSEACRQSGVAVPEEVAMLGVDNDDLLCELARPSLSSVAVPGESIGFEAASLLDQMLRGRGPARGRAARPPLLLPPRQVVTRHSSDILAVNDPYVAEALGVIRRRTGRATSVDDVVELVPLSRRSLERRFRSCLGRGVWEEIRRVQVERAKELLTGTEMPMSAVATAAGFSESKQLSVVFRQETRTTPSAYRRQTRVAGREAIPPMMPPGEALPDEPWT